MYYAKCLEEPFPHDYVGVSRRRVLEGVKHYNGRDNSSHIFQYFAAGDQQFVFHNGLRIVARNKHNNKCKRKIAEALLVKY